ncbi:hypothetical protein IAT40_007219 [Kwoniella sp. CBS 6097]
MMRTSGSGGHSTKGNTKDKDRHQALLEEGNAFFASLLNDPFAFDDSDTEQEEVGKVGIVTSAKHDPKASSIVGSLLAKAFPLSKSIAFIFFEKPGPDQCSEPVSSVATSEARPKIYLNLKTGEPTKRGAQGLASSSTPASTSSHTPLPRTLSPAKRRAASPQAKGTGSASPLDKRARLGDEKYTGKSFDGLSTSQRSTATATISRPPLNVLPTPPQFTEANASSTQPIPSTSPTSKRTSTPTFLSERGIHSGSHFFPIRRRTAGPSPSICQVDTVLTPTIKIKEESRVVPKHRLPPTPPAFSPSKANTSTSTGKTATMISQIQSSPASHPGNCSLRCPSHAKLPPAALPNAPRPSSSMTVQRSDARDVDCKSAKPSRFGSRSTSTSTSTSTASPSFSNSTSLTTYPSERDAALQGALEATAFVRQQISDLQERYNKLETELRSERAGQQMARKSLAEATRSFHERDARTRDLTSQVEMYKREKEMAETQLRKKMKSIVERERRHIDATKAFQVNQKKFADEKMRMAKSIRRYEIEYEALGKAQRKLAEDRRSIEQLVKDKEKLKEDQDQLIKDRNYLEMDRIRKAKQCEDWVEQIRKTCDECEKRIRHNGEIEKRIKERENRLQQAEQATKKPSLPLQRQESRCCNRNRDRGKRQK